MKNKYWPKENWRTLGPEGPDMDAQTIAGLNQILDTGIYADWLLYTMDIWPTNIIITVMVPMIRSMLRLSQKASCLP